MPDTSTDLIDLLHDIDPDRVTYIVQSDRKRYHAAIIALLEERDRLRKRVASERDALRKRIAELERDLAAMRKGDTNA